MFLASILVMPGAAALTLVGCPNPSTSQPIPYSTPTFNGVNFYTIGITNTQAARIFDLIEETYDNYLDSTEQSRFSTKIDNIYITNGTDVSKVGRDLYFGHNANLTEVSLCLSQITATAQIQRSDVIRLVQKLDNSKETVRLSMGGSGNQRTA